MAQAKITKSKSKDDENKYKMELVLTFGEVSAVMNALQEWNTPVAQDVSNALNKALITLCPNG